MRCCFSQHLQLLDLFSKNSCGFFLPFSCKLTPKFLSVPLKEFLKSLLCTLSAPCPAPSLLTSWLSSLHFIQLIIVPGCLCPLERSSSFQNPSPLHCGSALLFTLNWIWDILYCSVPLHSKIPQEWQETETAKQIIYVPGRFSPN